jgi:hypothetical protein
MKVAEIEEDLAHFIAQARTINENLRIILTVSPVPLVATATDHHVLSATIYSKSALRVAAQEVSRSFCGVIYFPSYEIVTGPQAPDTFFEPDKRNVSRPGVDAVMSAFLAACDGADHSSQGCQTEEPPLHRAESIAELSRLTISAECEEAMSDADLCRSL